MINFREISSQINSRYTELKGCGANKPGGGGFAAGNTCARGGGKQSTLLVDNNFDHDRLVRTELLAGDKRTVDPSTLKPVFGKDGDVYRLSLAGEENRVWAGISAKPTDEKGVFEIKNVFVTSTMGGQGVGTSLYRQFVPAMAENSNVKILRESHNQTAKAPSSIWNKLEKEGLAKRKKMTLISGKEWEYRYVNLDSLRKKNA